MKISDEALDDDIKMLTQLAEEMSGGMPPKILRYVLELKSLRQKAFELEGELRGEAHRVMLLQEMNARLKKENLSLEAQNTKLGISELARTWTDPTQGPQPPAKQKHKLLAYRLRSSSHGEHGYLYGQVYHFKANDLFTTEWERVPPADLEWEE